MANLDKTIFCAECGKEINPAHYHTHFNMKHYCVDCGLKLGIVGPMVWLEAYGIGIHHHAEYHDGTITAFQKWGRGYRKDVIKVL